MSVVRLRAAVVLLSLLPAGLCAAQAIPASSEERFRMLDINQDGVINKLEYDSYTLFNRIDSNDNNRISEDELQAVLGPQEDGMLSAADRIRVADGNQDGELTDEELRRAVEMRFAWLDRNMDGKLELSEVKSGFGIPRP